MHGGCNCAHPTSTCSLYILKDRWSPKSVRNPAFLGFSVTWRALSVHAIVNGKGSFQLYSGQTEVGPMKSCSPTHAFVSANNFRPVCCDPLGCYGWSVDVLHEFRRGSFVRRVICRRCPRQHGVPCHLSKNGWCTLTILAPCQWAMR